MTKEKKKSNQKMASLILIIVFFAAVFLGGILIGEFAASFAKGGSSGEKIVSLLIMLAAVWLAILFHVAVHEAGHLIFGLLSGYTFSSYRIGSFMWIKENGKLKLKRYSLAGTGGQCLMVPPDMVDGKFPTVLFNLGGSIMNLIISLIFIGIGLLLRDGSLLSGIMYIFAVMGFISAGTNGIPMRLGTIDNDGYNAYALRKSPEGMRSFWVQLRANEQISKGVRLKDMPAEWFEFPEEEHMNNSMAATMAVFACNRLMDECKFEEAEEKMRYYCEQDNAIVGLHKNLLRCDIIFCMILRNAGWKETVKMMTDEIKTFMKSMKNFPSVIRTQYAYALIVERKTGRTDERQALKSRARSKAPETAEEFKVLFEKVAKNYPYQSDIESERELIEIVDKVYETNVNQFAEPVGEENSSVI